MLRACSWAAKPRWPAVIPPHPAPMALTSSPRCSMSMANIHKRLPRHSTSANRVSDGPGPLTTCTKLPSGIQVATGPESLSSTAIVSDRKRKFFPVSKVRGRFLTLVADSFFIFKNPVRFFLGGRRGCPAESRVLPLIRIYHWVAGLRCASSVAWSCHCWR